MKSILNKRILFHSAKPHSITGLESVRGLYKINFFFFFFFVHWRYSPLWALVC